MPYGYICVCVCVCVCFMALHWCRGAWLDMYVVWLTFGAVSYCTCVRTGVYGVDVAVQPPDWWMAKQGTLTASV